MSSREGPKCYLCGEEIRSGDPFFEWAFPLRFSHSRCEMRGRTIEAEETQWIGRTRYEEADRNAADLSEVMRGNVIRQRKMDPKEEEAPDILSRPLALRILRGVRKLRALVVGSLRRKK